MAVIFLDDPENEHVRVCGRTLETGRNALEKALLINPRINQQSSILLADYKGDLS